MKAKHPQDTLAIVIAVYRDSLDNTKTIEQLCDEYGIARSTYYKYIRNHNEFFNELADFSREQKRILYTDIQLAKLRAIKMLTMEVTSPLLTPAARLNVIKALETYAEEFEIELNIAGEDDVAAQILRTLPPLEYGEHMLTPVEQTDKYNTGDTTIIVDC